MERGEERRRRRKRAGFAKEPGRRALGEISGSVRDNRRGVDSRATWMCAPCKMHFQLRHNHVVPALTGRCICVCEERGMYKYSFWEWILCDHPISPPLCVRAYLPYAGETGEGEKQSRGIICVCANMPAELPRRLFRSSFSPYFPPFSPSRFTSALVYIYMYVYVYVYVDLYPIAKALSLDTRRKSPWKQSNTGKRHQPIM